MATLTPPTESAAARLEIEDGLALIRMNAPDKPVNVLSAAMADSFREMLDRLEREAASVRAAVILSDKPGVWIAGADIEEFTKLRTAADGERLSRLSHELLGRIERLRFPVVAAIDGVALGGGLELALACTYRLASDSPKTKLGLPEVQLGILPGGGGTQRLPRLIGLRAALDLMLTGKQLDPRRARSIGLVDEIAPAAIFEEAARRVAAELADGTRAPRAGRTRGSPQWTEGVPGVRKLIFRKAREEVMGKTRGLYPAPLRILEVVEHGLDRPLDQGLDMEARAFGELSVTPEARALVHLFFASTAARNDPALPPGSEAREVRRAAVVGAGFMGASIAAMTAENEIPTRLKDISTANAARGLRTARELLSKRARRRRRPAHEQTQLLDRVQATHEYAGFAQVDLVVEAVFEDLDLKHRVIREIEEAGSPETIIGSNTSTIPISRLAAAAERPEQVIGLHFFSPVDKMPLLEIITTDRTAGWVTATCHAYGKRIGKTPIVVRDSPGFYVNRILTPYMNEAALLLQEGVPIEEIDDALRDWGMAVGPITLYDEVGIDVTHKAGQIMREELGDRLPVNTVIERMVEDDRLGRKNGRGFFLYQDGEKKAPDPSVYSLIGSPARRSPDRREVQDRVMLMMVDEAVRTLEEGVIQSARDGDVGAVLGIGFAPFRGGPFWHLDQAGPANVVGRLRELQERHGDRFAPAALLVRKAESGERFSEES